MDALMPTTDFMSIDQSSTKSVDDSSISIVIPCFNAIAYLERAIDSLKQQEGVNVQIIVIDDGSTDGSINLIKSLPSVDVWKSGPNKGACAARNRGLSLAIFPYVMFWDADDYLDTGTLKGLVSALKDSRSIFAIAPMVMINDTGERISKTLPRNDKVTNFIADWVRGRYVSPCSILWKTEAVRRLGGWNESLSKNQDGDIVLRAALTIDKVAISSCGAGIYWCHDGESRISNSLDETKLRDSFYVFSNIYEQLKKRGMRCDEIDNAFSYATHSLERLAARNRLYNIKKEIKDYRKDAGWPYAEGPPLHIFLSRIIGLDRKERLAHQLKSLMH